MINKRLVAAFVGLVAMLAVVPSMMSIVTAEDGPLDQWDAVVNGEMVEIGAVAASVTLRKTGRPVSSSDITPVLTAGSLASGWEFPPTNPFKVDGPLTVIAYDATGLTVENQRSDGRPNARVYNPTVVGGVRGEDGVNYVMVLIINRTTAQVRNDIITGEQLSEDYRGWIGTDSYLYATTNHAAEPGRTERQGGLRDYWWHGMLSVMLELVPLGVYGGVVLAGIAMIRFGVSGRKSDEFGGGTFR